MTYISPIYKDSRNYEQYFSKEATENCKRELAQKRICVVLRHKRTHIIFFVSNDISIEQILASFQIPIAWLSKTIRMTLNQEEQVFTSPASLTDFQTPLRDIGLTEQNQVNLILNQEQELSLPSSLQG
jgi:hypothetical protein